MFTPTRKKKSSLSNRCSVITPRAAALQNVSRTSLLRRSIATRHSLNMSTTSMIGSPTITTVFGSTHHSVDSYDSSIPVLITEAIALADDVSEVSVKISKNGWSWLVSGEKLFVWSHQSGMSKIPTCKELTLRTVEDEDVYLSELVSVDYNENTGCVAVLAVSNFGQAIYWPNILVSTVSSGELKVDFGSQNTNCFCVVSVQQHGFVLCTASGSLYYIIPLQSGLVCKEVNKRKGALSSIGRRVSSFFFSQPQENENVVQLEMNPTKTYGEYELFVLTETNLQQWKCLFDADKESATVQLTANVDLNETLQTRLSTEIWDSEKPSCSMWSLDVARATSRGQVAVLLALAESSDRDATLYYVVCLFDDLISADDIKVIVLEHTNLYSASFEDQLFSYKLVVDDPAAWQLMHFAVWSGERILLKSLVSVDGEYKEDNVPFDGPGNHVLGAGQYQGRCIFFSAAHGLITSSSSLERNVPFTSEESLLDMTSAPSPSTSTMKSLPGTPVMSQSKMDKLEASEGSAQRLQAAFLHYCRLNMDQARDLVGEAFPLDVADESLDNAVVLVSGELMDDYPAQDPRWAESVPSDFSSESSTSLILQHQLEDKLKAHKLFLKFLTDVEIWDRLTYFGSGRDRVVTRWLLWEHAEKLHASIGLLQKHPAHQSIVDGAIRQVLNRRENLTNAAGLTPRDFFYREVTRVDEIFEPLLEEEQSALLKSFLSSRDKATVVAGVNAVIESMLTRVYQYRKTLNLLFEDREGKHCEFIPWTVGSGRSNIRGLVVQQHKFTVDRGIPKAEDGQQRVALCQSLASLADLVLTGYVQQLASLPPDDVTARRSEVNAAYTSHRSELIKPLLKVDQVEKAASLAEKYHDFDILIQICDEGGDAERLRKYMTKFSDETFPEYLFRWYLDRGEYRKLFSSCDETQVHRLKTFLCAHPNLAWMQQIQAGEYKDAHDTLRYLAAKETKSATKKKHYLSLSKLSAVFSGDTQDSVEEKIEDIAQEHTMLRYQETLPSAVMNFLEVNPDDTPVYSPDQLIQLYISDRNERANEVDFKKAFELLRFLPEGSMDDDDEEATATPDEWKLRIWCQLILRDNWKDTDTTLDPFDACSHTVLFRTLMLAHASGLLADIFPDVHALLHRDELNKLLQDPAMEYLMRASFERVERSLLSSAA